MKTVTKEDLTNEQLNEHAEELADLSVAVEQAQQTKGGPHPGEIEVSSFSWGVSNPGNNHNETVTEDEATTSEALADLPVEDAEQVKGGPTSSTPSGTGKVISAVLLGKSY